MAINPSSSPTIAKIKSHVWASGRNPVFEQFDNPVPISYLLITQDSLELIDNQHLLDRSTDYGTM